jgi:hypothetical protein
MSCARTIITAATLLVLVSNGLADTFQDDFFVDLDASQITHKDQPVAGDAWTRTNLQMLNASLVLTGDNYIGNIDFLNNESLSLAVLQGVELEVRANPSIYTIDFSIIGETQSGDLTLLSASASSDVSGTVSGFFSGGGANADLTGVRFEFDQAAGNVMYDSFDLVLRARTITVIPEPASLTLLFVAATAAAARRRSRRGSLRPPSGRRVGVGHLY